MEKSQNKEYQFYKVILFIFSILMALYCMKIFNEYYDGNEISNLSKSVLNKLYDVKSESYIVFKIRMDYKNFHLKFGSFFSIFFLIMSYVMDYLSNFKLNRGVTVFLRITLISILILISMFVMIGVWIWTSWD